MKPKVSIIIPTCNRPNLIKRAINSVLKQTFQDFEIIIVDDGFKERAEKVVKNIKDERIKYIQHEVNKGGGAARNTGIKATQGEYIAFLDDDDEWVLEKLGLQMSALENTTDDVGFCFTAVENIYDERTERSHIPEGKDNYHNLALSSFKKFLTVTLVIKKNVFDEIGFFDENLPSHQEAELMIRVTKKFLGVGINQPLVRVNMKSEHSQVGKNYARKINGAELLIKKHFDKYKDKSEKLAKHYFQLGIYCRDNKEIKKARRYFLKAWKLNYKEIRYLFHFFVNIVK